MVRASMGKFDLALEDGDKAVKLDASWSKGHFRRGKALSGLNRCIDAHEAFEQAAKLAPDDKGLKKEVANARDAADKEHKARLEAENAAGEKPVEKAAVAKERQPKDKTPPKRAKAEATAEEAKPAADRGDAEVGGDMRGYKLRADGTKTSFFDHEMTKEERKLLGYDANGNLKPKSISAEEARRMEEQYGEKAGEASVWAGNTWEDRKMDGWAQEQLEKRLMTCVFEPPERPGAVLKVKEIKDWTGTASIYIKQGRKRWIFDLNFKVIWEASGFEEKDVEGEIKFADVLPDDVADDDIVGLHKTVGDAPTGEILQ